MNAISIRIPAVAGMFYPDKSSVLRHDVTTFLHLASTRPLLPPPKALIAPHAGYIYSGPIAGSAYASLGSDARQKIQHVILLGPTHRVGFNGIATSSADFFRTPLGDVPVDRIMTLQAESCPGVISYDRAHRDEHSLEVHLPFLQCALGKFDIIPLVVGNASPKEVATVIEHLWGNDDTLIIVSSDLSHYLTYDQATQIDRSTSESIAKMNPEELGFDQACGCLPIQGLLIAAKRHHLSVHILDVRNSGDTAGDRTRVVGYGAYAFN